MTSLATLNLNYGRKRAPQQADVDRARADIIATQEDVRGIWRERVDVPRPRPDGLRVVRRGRVRANRHPYGYEIRRRWFPWALVQIPDVGRVYVVSVHMPPARMAGLYPVFTDNLHRLLDRFEDEHPWVVGGDWNRPLRDDPAGLRTRYRASYYGNPLGIDGWVVHPTLNDQITGVDVRRLPHRRDGHPIVTIHLGGRP